MSFFRFLIVNICFTALFSWYIGRRLIVPARLKASWNRMAWAFLLYVLLTIPFQVLLRRAELESFWIDLIAWTGYTGLGFFALVLTFMILRDIASILAAGIKKLMRIIVKLLGFSSKKRAPVDPGRRLLILNSMNAGIMVASGILTGYGLFESRRSPEIKKVLIPIENLPDDLSGFTIAQISDIHVSPTIKRDWVETIVDKVNSLTPDIIAFTGDLADGSVERLQTDVAPLSDLDAKYGKYFVTGNHEYYSGVNGWINEIKRLGFTVLINEHRIIRRGKARILIGGVTDYKGGQFLKSHASSPKAAIEGALPSDIKLLLAHQPKNIFSAAKAGFDLQISGHTHGGQFFPWNYVVCLDQPFVSGLHKFKNTQIYVSNGTGYWGPPLRLGVPSEITLLQLTVS